MQRVWPGSSRAVTRIRLILNGGLSGPHAWFCLAQQRGYFEEAGLDIEFITGEGAAAVVPLVGHDGIDAGYGDINALAEIAACGPGPAPVAVFAMFNSVPFTIAVRADSRLRRAADLAGSRLCGHRQDAALKLFPTLADRAGFAAESATITASSLGLGQQVRDLLLPGQVDGVFGFVNTIIAAVTPLGVDPARLRFIEFADTLPDLYANCLMVSRAWLERAPQQVQGLVTALNRGLVETLDDLDVAIDAVARAAPATDRSVQHRRLAGTLAAEMAHPEGARIGIGDVDDARLQRGLDLMARTLGWPRVPRSAEVFDRRFLPPLAQRVKSLARAA